MILFRGKVNKLIAAGDGAYGIKDYKTAFKNYKEAAEYGDPRALRKLGKMYQRGLGTEVNYRKAVFCYERSAVQGDAAAENALGNMYYYGTGVEEDLDKAASLYGRAAVKGSMSAQYNLGFMYENGYGTTQNYAAALRWYRNAAFQGSALGQNALGDMFRYGRGVSRNVDEALKWYRLSAEKGCTAALESMKTLTGENSAEKEEKVPEIEAPTESPDERLEKMIGLAGVKDEITRMISLVKIQKLREDNGMKTVPLSKHLVFAGNPGTGKTTVARLLAEKYREIGVLSKGQLVEVSRADLVAGYVGQTAIRTKKKIAEAIGGILFIDEAYTLAEGGENDFGKEAIETLLKEMEDNRDDLVVIAAGYPELMESFLSSNPGLRSRFSKTIVFDDYSASELFAIFNAMCAGHGLKLTEEAAAKAEKRIAEMEADKGRNFANAREVRNLFERIYSNQALRLAKKENFTLEDILIIEAEDID